MTATVTTLRPFTHLLVEAQLKASLEPDELDGAEILRLAAARFRRQADALEAQADEIERACIPNTVGMGGDA